MAKIFCIAIDEGLQRLSVNTSALFGILHRTLPSAFLH